MYAKRSWSFSGKQFRTPFYLDGRKLTRFQSAPARLILGERITKHFPRLIPYQSFSWSMESPTVLALDSRHMYLATCHSCYDLRVIELLSDEKMNVYERVRLYLFTWFKYIFLYIYLTFAFGFHWTVGNISLGIKRTLIVVLSRGGHVCSGWRDIPKHSCIFFQESRNLFDVKWSKKE